MKTTLLLALATGLSLAARATNDPMTGALASLSAQLQPVKTASAQFVQKIEAAQPAYRATFTISRTTDKGKSSEETYFLNLADLDPATVAYKVERDVIAVVADTKQHRNFIRHTEDGDWKALTDRLKLYADNPDIAKALVEALKKAVVSAEKAYVPAQTPDTMDGLRQWLKTAIAAEVIGTEKYEQALTFDAENPLRAVLRQSRVGEKGNASTETYSFNLGDLTLDGLQIDTRGPRLELKLQTLQKRKLVGYAKDGKLENVVNGFELFSADPDRLRDVMAAWRKLIPQAVKQLQAKQPVFNSFDVARKTLEASIQTAKTSDRTIEQTLKAECLCTYTRRETGKKSNVEETYELNLADLAPQGTKLGVDKELYTIELKTRDNQKYIGYLKNGVRQNYVNGLELAADNLESVRFLNEAVEKAIQACAQSRKSPVPTASLAARLAWIDEQLAAVNGALGEKTQKFAVATAPSDFKLTVAEGGRKPTELVYDLDLKALNADATQVDVSGREVFVTLTTKGREKLIKTAKDGKPSNYVHTVQVQADGIERARALAEAFRGMIAGGGGK